ncbi:hypothetical protein [Anaerobacillus sp. 1_MG-2023]|uniref:hypothetical protein n=1 Tax=Anaerobacillus sp. 1_MG-2023 TaxID=3062655 RepID=UPI0026E27C73|nr:hypothetical protein [Anaerobacillus sp. 1_MG-2023]MDO6658237.1 hypothetical protein [Anaerobacillus sp. 1_MG-2023]
MNLFEYYEEKVLNLTYQNATCSGTFNISSLFDGTLEFYEQAWDAFIRVTLKGRKPVESQVYTRVNSNDARYEYQTLSSNNALKMKPYITGKKTFALLLRKKDIVVEIVEPILIEDALHVEGESLFQRVGSFQFRGGKPVPDC